MPPERLFVLTVVTRFESLERAVLDALSRDGAQVIIYDIQNNRIYLPSSPRAYAPFFGGAAGNTFISGRELEELCQTYDVGMSLAIGLEAMLLFAPILPAGVLNEGLIANKELDFSARRHGARAQQVQALSRSYARIFFETQYSFIKALDKGIESQHFLLDIDPRPVGRPGKILRRDARAIGYIVGANVSDAQVHRRLRDIQDRLPGYGVRLLREDGLLEDTSVPSGRGLWQCLQDQLGDLSHLIIESCSRDTVAILRCLQQDADCIVVADEFSLHTCVWDIEAAIGLSDSQALITDLIRKMKTPPAVVPAQPGPSLVDQLLRAGKGRFPEFYEDYLCLRQDKPIDVYFSVTTIEEHSNGARALRVRNMYLGFRDLGRNVLDISSISSVIARRLKMVRHLIEQGTAFGVFYGENSTAPIHAYQSISTLGALLAALRGAGVKSAWYIRDLHFMYDSARQQKDATEMINRACFEFTTLSQSIDVFYTPTSRTTKEFREKLPPQENPQTLWKELPPGMSALTPAPVTDHGPKRIAFVYTGGMSRLYDMSSYFAAIQALSGHDDIRFDFVVRPGEQAFLEENGMTSDLGNIRVLNGSFEEYRAEARQVCGIALFENPYANGGFPLKVLNYVSHQMPVLHFDTASFSGFLRHYGTGLAVPQNRGAVLAAITALVEKARQNQALLENPDFEGAYRDHSWQQRCRQVLRDLS